MKIISGGLFAKDGIHIRCERCGCEYIVEDKSDFKLSIMLDNSITYEINCPECNHRQYLGSLTFKDNKTIFSSILSNRKDWEERYCIHSIEEAKKYNTLDYFEMYGYNRDNYSRG